MYIFPFKSEGWGILVEKLGYVKQSWEKTSRILKLLFLFLFLLCFSGALCYGGDGRKADSNKKMIKSDVAQHIASLDS